MTLQLDPQLQSLLQMMQAQRQGQPQPTSPAEALHAQRGGYRQMGRLGGEPEAVHSVENRSLQTAVGSIPVRLYRPSAAPVLPGLVYFHGGAFTSGDLESHDIFLRALANRSGVAIVAVDYRLAPEHPFPASLEDAYAAAQYVLANPAEFGLEAGRVAVGGDSAGGTLATVVTHLAEERGGLRPKLQLLIQPNTDATLSRTSWQANGMYTLGKDWMAANLEMLTQGEVALDNPKLSPLFAPDLSGLPKTVLLSAELDPLVDEESAYAERLEAAGVEVERLHYAGMVHAFTSMFGVLDAGKQALGDLGEVLQRNL